MRSITGEPRAGNKQAELWQNTIPRSRLGTSLQTTNRKKMHIEGAVKDDTKRG